MYGEPHLEPICCVLCNLYPKLWEDLGGIFPPYRCREDIKRIDNEDVSRIGLWGISVSI